jgi:DNA polymerase-3 subunit delta
MQNLAPVYLLSSDEPLLVRDWLDEIRATMKQQGFEDIQNLSADTGIDWNELVSELDMPSLFADKKCRIVRIPNGKPGQQGAKAIGELCERLATDTVFIFVLPRLDRAIKNSAWYKRAQQIAEVDELPSVKAQQLPDWIRHRASLKSLSIDVQSAAFLAERTEGNLLAADQELEKLSIRFSGENQAQLSFEIIEQSVAQSSRYNHFILVDACLDGKLKRAMQVLSSLATEGYVTNSLLWALQSALEKLACLKQTQMSGQISPQLWQRLRIWGASQSLYQRALTRLNLDQIECLLQSCATLDRIGKGQQDAAYTDADWLQMKLLVSDFCGVRSIQNIEAVEA